MRFWQRSACVAGLMVLGCGPKQPAKPPAVPLVVATAPPVEEAPDLSPVTKPAEVVLVGHLARPKALSDTLATWSSLPLHLEDALPPPLKPLSKAIAWDAPVDFVAALDTFGEGKVPPPLFVVSVGLTSLDAALKAADAGQTPTRKLAPGVYRLGDLGDASCALALSLGKAPARLVCGHGSRDLDALLPYATRGLPSEPVSGADFELTLDAGPLQAHYGHDVATLRLLAGIGERELALDSARFDRALSDAIYGGVDEVVNLFNDLDQVRLTARLDGARHVLTASGELRLKGDSSWVAGTLSALEPAPIPATLPRLPPGTTLASYVTAQPAERYVVMQRILGELAEGFLEYEKLPAASVKRVRHLSDALFAKFPETFTFALPSSASDDGSPPHVTRVTRFSEPAARVLGLYNDAYALLRDPALKRYAKTKLDLDDKAWPRASKKPLRLSGFKQTATLFEVSLDPSAWKGLDPKIAHGLQSVLSAPNGQSPRLEVAVQPDGDFTYLVVGDDPRELTRAMAEVRKSEPGAYFARPAASNAVVAAGFFTLAYLAQTLDRGELPVHDLAKLMSLTPHHGETPIPFASTAGPGLARVDVEIPAAVLADTSAAVVGGVAARFNKSR